MKKKEELDVTCYFCIENVRGNVRLWNIYDDEKGGFYMEPVLEFVGIDIEGWDNSEYTYKFLEKVKKSKHDRKIKKLTKELNSKIKDGDLFDWESLKKDLLMIFKKSKQLKMWKKR